VELLKIGLKEWRATAVVCQNGGEKRVLDVCARLLGGFSGITCLSFRDRFDILLGKRPSGVAELRYAIVYRK
jgi:hypothetical protein